MELDYDTDDRALADLADAQLSRWGVRWVCPYCDHELTAEYSPCCGEQHAQPMPEGWDDDNGF